MWIEVNELQPVKILILKEQPELCGSAFLEYFYLHRYVPSLLCEACLSWLYILLLQRHFPIVIELLGSFAHYSFIADRRKLHRQKFSSSLSINAPPGKCFQTEKKLL